MTRVLIVDDDASDLESTAMLAQAAGYVALKATSGDAALGLLRADPGIAAVILDLVMPERDGMAVLEVMRREHLSRPVIVQASIADPELIDTAMRAGAVDFFLKPATRERLAVSLRNALKLEALATALRSAGNRRNGAPTPSDIAAGAAMDRVVALCGRAARSNIPVLIEGESGTGKQLVARIIHGLGDRVARPFVTFDCAAFPDSTMAASLFGSSQGTGRLAAARNGTLLLREIDALPSAPQARLLNLLETGELPATGNSRPDRPNVRIIATSRRRLLNLARTGEFREDLYYRLNVLPIYLPPLRHRPEDIPALAARLVTHIAAELGKAVDGISAEALAMLQSYPWPGNIRQLENVLYRAVALAESPLLAPVDLPQLLVESAGREATVAAVAMLSAASAPVHIDVATARPRPPGIRGENSDRFITEGNEVTPLAKLERDIIVFAIGKYQGHMSRIARALGIGRSTLYRKLRDYGLEASIASDAA